MSFLDAYLPCDCFAQLTGLNVKFFTLTFKTQVVWLIFPHPPLNTRVCARTHTHTHTNSGDTELLSVVFPSYLQAFSYPVPSAWNVLSFLHQVNWCFKNQLRFFSFQEAFSAHPHAQPQLARHSDPPRPPCPLLKSYLPSLAHETPPAGQNLPFSVSLVPGTE